MIRLYVINKKKYNESYIKDVDEYNKAQHKNKDVVILMDTTKTMRQSYRMVKGEVDNFIKALYNNGNNRVGLMGI
ncbi:MAG: hypothetical protein ACRC7N_07695 [Clostridium sp.]